MPDPQPPADRQSRRVFAPPRVAAAVLAMALLPACAARPHVAPIDRIAFAGLDEPFPDGSYAETAGKESRLRVDVRRAATRLHWAVERISGGTLEEGRRRPLRAALLLPDGRTAEVVASGAGEGRVAVAVRIGRFGDEKLERRFLDTLAEVLRGKAMRQRPKFRLPDLTPRKRPR